MAEKTVGILGGMGPDATVDLLHRIIRLTPASDDVDHIRCIVDSNPKVPSRIRALIEGTGEDPAPAMADMAKRLADWGADFLAIACNTAHYYYPSIQKAVSIPVINLIEVVTTHLRENFPGQSRIGMLASPAVKTIRLFSRNFQEAGLSEIWPDAENMDRILQVIKSVKKGEAETDIRTEYKTVGESLKARGAQILLVACTELSYLNERHTLPAVDSADVLAEKIVKTAKTGF
jgi:aspartate racemase